MPSDPFRPQPYHPYFRTWLLLGWVAPLIWIGFGLACGWHVYAWIETDLRWWQVMLQIPALFLVASLVQLFCTLVHLQLSEHYRRWSRRADAGGSQPGS